MNVFSKKCTYFKLLINNGPKWPDTFQKSCSFCCKIFLSVYFGALKYIKVLNSYKIWEEINVLLIFNLKLYKDHILLVMEEISWWSHNFRKITRTYFTGKKPLLQIHWIELFPVINLNFHCSFDLITFFGSSLNC